MVARPRNLISDLFDPGRPQRRASDPAVSAWVAASAGTGKTKVLTDRVLRLMLAGSAPERILCLTFTKAAASEMANRVNAELGRWAILSDGLLTGRLQALTGELPDAEDLRRARRLFARVLDAPGGMRIETIHAFCQGLLRRFPIEAAVAPHFEVMDERGAAEARAEAREATLAAARRGDDRALASALSYVTEIAREGRLDELLTALVADRGRLELMLAGGWRAFEGRVRDAFEIPPGATANGVVAAACEDAAFDVALLREAAAALCNALGTNDRKCGERIAAWYAAPERRAERFDDYLAAFFTAEGEPRKTLTTKSFASAFPHFAQALLAERERVSRASTLRGACRVAEASVALGQLAAALVAEYEAHKQRRGLLDYEDLILKSCALLERQGVAAWVLFKLDGGIDHILVDEAQDTNPEQWRVVKALAAEFFAGEGARAVNRTVFAVGDAKQSIYSFQRAQPLEFIATREHFEGRVRSAEHAARTGFAAVDLTTSFRSLSAVLTAVDAVFASPQAREGVALDGKEVEHYAHRGRGGLVEVWPPVQPDPLPDPKPWEAPVEQHRERAPSTRLAAAVAGTIRRWLDTGERLAYRDRPIRAGDVMVLVRRRNEFVVDLVRFLKGHGIPVAGADRMVLSEQLAVEDLMALGDFLLLPEDDLTLACVLKSPLFGIDDEALFALAHPRKRTLWAELQRRSSDDPMLAAAREELSALLGRADFVPPFELFAEVLGARGGRRAALSRLGAEAADPIDEFMALALAYEKTHAPSLQGFLHWMRAGRVEVKRDLDQRGRDEVRILTVHGAKGLQAPIVFLPDTCQLPVPGLPLFWTDDGLMLWARRKEDDPPPARRARAARQRLQDEEYRRLLYVAMTRAEERLYVCGWETRQGVRDRSWHRLVADAMAPLAERVEVDFAEVAGKDGWSGTALRLVHSQERLDPDPADAARGPVQEELPPWATRPPAPEPDPPRPLAPSEPAWIDPPPRSPLDAASGTLGFRRGLIVHRLLQALPDLAEDERETACLRWLARPAHGLSADQQDAIAAETLAVLRHPDFSAIFGPGSRAEVPVVGLVGGRALSGQIDRVLVAPGEVLIIDYKTLRPPPAREEDVPEAYLRQLAAYGAALRAIYPDREVRAALLWTEGPRLMPISSALLARWSP